MLKIAIIGYGKLTRAITKPLLNNSIIQLSISSPSFEHSLPPELAHVSCSSDNTAFLDQADVVVLGVKPQILGIVLAEIAHHLDQSSVLMSLAAGTTTTKITQWLATPNVNIVRAMPNICAQSALSTTPLFSAQKLQTHQQHHVEQFCTLFGSYFWIEQEEQMDVLTALVGSGPAFVHEFIHQLSHACQTLGLPNTLAPILASDVCFAAAKLAKDAPLDIQTTQNQVVSKGGTTAAGLAALQQHDFAATISACIKAATTRAKEISNS